MKNKKTNVVFFFTDDQRFDTIAALGNDVIKTPNLDALVHRGTAFTNAHIPCGTCGAVCMPSRAMLNTGRKLFSITGSGQTIVPEHTTIGEALKKNGYTTFATGKWHNGKKVFNRCFSDGAEIFFGGMADHWNVPAYDYDPDGKYDKTCSRCVDYFYSNRTEDIECDHITAGKHSSEMVCDAALNFLDSYDSEDPFYMYISFLAPHDPKTMPEEFRNMYNSDEIKLPPNFLGGHPFPTGALNIRDEKLASFPRDPEETKRHIAEYYGMISHLDDRLGRVVEALKAKGEYENTIIVFAGDNGLALGQHGLFGKQNCYEPSVRVPLIFAGPGIPENKQTEAPAYLFDIFPTLCDLTGTSLPESVEGSSLIKAIEGDDNVRDSLYFAYDEYQRAVKKDGFKLIEYVFEKKHVKTQLFDLHNDPWEMTDLADNTSYSEMKRKLRAELLRLRDEWNDFSSEWGQKFWSACSF